MSDLNFEFGVRIPPGVLSGALAGLLLGALSSELSPESVSLTTYFPAPSGVYGKLITTGSTYLARDSNNGVGIGTTNLASSSKLHVPGLTVLENGTILEGRDGGGNSGGPTRFRIKSESSSLNFYGYDTAEFQFMSVSNGGGKTVNLSANTGFASVTPQAALDVGGVIVLRQPRSDCAETTFVGGANTQCSPVGSTYATMIVGVISKVSVPWGTSFGVGTPGSGYMLCCKCPASGCPSGAGWD